MPWKHRLPHKTPSLFYQSLVIVGLPALLFVGVNAIALYQNFGLERLYEQENHTRLVLSNTADLSTLFVGSANVLMHFYATRDNKDIGRLRGILADVARKNRELETLVKDRPDEAKAFRQIKTDILQTIAQTDAIADDFSVPLSIDTALDAYERRRNVERLMQKTSKDTEQLLASLKQRQLTELGSNEALRQQQRFFNIGAILASVCLSILLALYFSRFISNRLRTMMQNTELVKDDAPLLDPVVGTDEIAVLDQQFHSMYGALQATKAKERELETTKRRFYAMITHDLRSPLTAIKLSLQSILIIERDNIPPRVANTLENASASSFRLTRLINDLLDIEKITEGKLELYCTRVSARDMVAVAIESISPIAGEAGVQVVDEVEDSDIYCDRDRIVQVLINLLSNAIKFSPAGESVRVTAETTSGWLKLGVMDRGPGIGAEQQASLFDAYVQGADELANKSGGTGLGLTICKLIVEQHDGEIGVDSSSGNGAKFWFKLPLV